jgi:hypothetical protein
MVGLALVVIRVVGVAHRTKIFLTDLGARNRFQGHTRNNGQGKPTSSSLSADGFPLMVGPNFQPSDGNPTVISILRQLADALENVPEM